MKYAATRTIAILGLSLAISTGHALLRHLPWVPDPDAQHEFRATVGVGLDQFLCLIDEGAIVIDTRPAPAFAEGHLAAAHALVLNVPADEVDLHLPRLRELQGCPFVLHCSSAACDLSEEVYIALIDAGFDPADLFIYFPGWEGIVEAGLETTVGEELSATG